MKNEVLYCRLSCLLRVSRYAWGTTLLLCLTLPYAPLYVESTAFIGVRPRINCWRRLFYITNTDCIPGMLVLQWKLSARRIWICDRYIDLGEYWYYQSMVGQGLRLYINTNCLIEPGALSVTQPGCSLLTTQVLFFVFRLSVFFLRTYANNRYSAR